MNGNQPSRYGAITRVLPATLGKIFFVGHADDSWTADLSYEFPVDRDGDQRFYPTVASADTDDLAIQAALDKCVAGRNDYVIVMPSTNDYDLGAKLTMSKRDVHLIGMDYLSNRQEEGSNSAVKIHQTYDDDIILLTGGNCEVAGFYFKNYNNQGTIVVTGGIADCMHIHHNHFNLNATSTSGVPQIDCSASSSSFILIERNTFATNVSSLTFSSIINIGSSNTWAKVFRNNFMIGDGCTITSVIYNISYKGQVHYNTIGAANGGGGATSTISNCITIGGGSGFGNYMAVVDTTTTDLSGGGSYSWVLNYNGVNGGTLATPS